MLETIGVVKKENGSSNLLLLPAHSPRSFDYVLVSQNSEDNESKGSVKKERDFISALKDKNLQIMKFVDDDNIFYGIKAPKEIFETYKHLLKVSDACNWSCAHQGHIPQSTRIRIVDFILHHSSINTEGGPEFLSDLIKSNVFAAQFCLHEFSMLFDNEGTVAFAMFMAVWATVFLEFWKCHRASYVYEWKVFDWCEEEEELILEIVNNYNCEPRNQSHSYLRSTVIMVLVTLMVNRTVALKLCEIEKVRSHDAIERSFTVKMFTFQFFTLFSSLIYTAFFLGRINGHPGGYVRIAGIWRLEECHPSGCLMDLFIQMGVIMFLKQTISNVIEFSGPWFMRWLKRRKSRKLRRKVCQCLKKECMAATAGSAELCDNCKIKDLLRNFDLKHVDSFSLFNEFLEMVLQFSFTTIFVAAFPLAPLLALLNNIIEIRLDAIKMVTLERRLLPKKTKDIGVWTDVLEIIGVLAVIANGMVIGITSDFIPRLVYRYRYGPCASSNATDVDCMSGYIKNTLSIANINDENIRRDFLPLQLITHNQMNVTYCSYKDYRSNEDYTLTSQFWVIQAVRFAFIILFEHVVVVCKSIAGWYVPSSPLEVKNNRLEDKLHRLKKELRSVSTLLTYWNQISCDYYFSK
ncbi:hypothetical protein P4O66_015765 [Electrophorus voltai]|uniref:Anoctamin n=1 Tax=Electrophorus voltai TaxID=2609070 RepID=A0AAD8Z1P2_9TELE|nr:hypothetical protein P4O66_015765 [Electrophorus voltai]